MNSAVIFGAGNIGRSFIGSIFASNGWNVTFIDANKNLVDKLNTEGEYTILVKRNNQPDEPKIITGINALHSSEHDAIIEKLSACNICATSVGQGALKFVVPQIAESVKHRAAENRPPLDIIIAENIRNGAAFIRSIFIENGLNGNEAGLIETSIGKMVPIMSEADLADDPLILHAEEYNTLILDGKGFKGKIPGFPEIKAVKNIAAWVDRKLFIHNLGHAAAAYFGFEKYPERRLIADVIREPELQNHVRTAMCEASAALLAEYPSDFSKKDLDDHINDLLFRFGNLALGDTVFRVGRDLYRKLNLNDRVCGAAALCLKHGLPCNAVIDVFNSALKFEAADESGQRFGRDIEFHSQLKQVPLEKLLITALDFNSANQELINLFVKPAC